MATEIKVPDIGDFKDVPVIDILVKEGDAVNAEDPVITLESDKATMEVPAPHSGTVEKILVKVGDRVSEGTPILTMKEGEGGMKQPPSVLGQQEPAPVAPPPKTAPAAAAPVQGGGAVDFGGVHASPSVRRLARELQVDLTKLKGTGEKGRITLDDVRNYLAGPTTAPTAKGAVATGGMGIPDIPPQDFAKFGAIETRPLARIKKLSGPHLHRAWLNVPHVTHNDEADITEIEAYRKDLDAAAKEKGFRVTMLAFLAKASVSALRAHPEFNSSLSPEKDALILKKYYNVGVAVDTPEGLVVPVIKDADRKGIHEISQDLGMLSKRHAGRHVLDFKPWRHRRHRVYANRQCARSCDSGRCALENGASVEWCRVQGTADAAAMLVLRSPCDRWRTCSAVRAAPVPLPGRRATPDPLIGRDINGQQGETHEHRNSRTRHRRLQGCPDHRDFREAGRHRGG